VRNDFYKGKPKKPEETKGEKRKELGVIIFTAEGG